VKVKREREKPWDNTKKKKEGGEEGEEGKRDWEEREE